MKDFENQIKLVEDKWLNELYSYCKQIFSVKKIPSHGHTHHLRVWEYSKEILTTLNSTFDINKNLIEGTLIASLFHDTGLTENLSEAHGNESRKLCLEYFDKTSKVKPENFEEILYTIEIHDDKDYKLNISDPDSILSVLCNADDLDAFGRTGVVRYTEIYLLRGIEMDKLPHLVIKNLNKRFANFERTYKTYKSFYEKHKERYLITRKFFEKLEEEFTL